MSRRDSCEIHELANDDGLVVDGFRRGPRFRPLFAECIDKLQVDSGHRPATGPHGEILNPVEDFVVLDEGFLGPSLGFEIRAV